MRTEKRILDFWRVCIFVLSCRFLIEKDLTKSVHANQYESESQPHVVYNVFFEITHHNSNQQYANSGKLLGSEGNIEPTC